MNADMTGVINTEEVFIFEMDLETGEEKMTEEQLEDTVFNCLDFCLLNGKTAHFFLRVGNPAHNPELWRVLELLHGEDVSFTLLSEPEKTAFDRNCTDCCDENKLIIRSNGLACWEGLMLGSVLEDRLADMWIVSGCHS